MEVAYLCDIDFDWVAFLQLVLRLSDAQAARTRV